MRYDYARRVMLIMGSAWLGACANGTLPERAARHPGHPGAPEGYARVELASLADDAKHEHAAKGGAPAEGTTYVCPMHPEVVDGAPGTCPKCGMKLVPKPTPPKPIPSATP
jgi:heavy metal-binding protein